MIDEYKIKDRILLESVQSKMDNIYASALGRQKLSLGYPLNQKFDYTAIAPFLNLHLNNVGDPYASSSTLLNTHELEQETLDYFAKLWHATPRTPLIPDSFWGYVLVMGATEGNMYALWSACEYFQVRHGESSRHPILYFSPETHYSIEKCAKIVGIETFQKMGNQYYPGQCPITEDGHWPNDVPVDKHGAIDPESLSTLVNFFTANGYPSIIVLNLGTTFRGAFDDPQIVWQNLSQLFDRDSYHRQTNRLGNKDLWIHIDGALGAAYLPYLEIAFENVVAQTRSDSYRLFIQYLSG
ncbi:pyridoxal-dependent decarboxylase [Arsenophonus nasoniae]|uniref:pyridoxal-dependent decarboxylase n=1 Tax=Arsenophonus nasoniae TaxID=638 RepID=UPI00387A679E